MTTLKILKRTTAIAALAALPLTPAAVLAESAQATGTQPPSAGQQAQQAGQQTGPDNVEEQQLPGTADQTRPGAGDPWTQSGQQAGAQAGQSQAATEERDPANEAGIVTEGKEGTQSGEAPDQAPTGDQTGMTEERDPANEAGIVTEGKEGTQSGEAPDQAPTGDQTGSSETGGQGQTGQQGTAAGQTGQQGAAAGQQAKAGQDQDAVVAKVGDREIRRSDVLTVIGMLPPQLQQQPPEMLIPIALDQLVMRELILEKAKEAGLENDPAVTSLAEDASERAKEDAMVQVWLDKELGKAVTDAKVQETYDTVRQQLGDQAPTIDVLRPQIEQELRQQAFLDLSEELQANADITLYGPDGQPITQTQ